jgi:hypothetical protein
VPGTLHGLQWTLVTTVGPLVYWRVADRLGNLEGVTEGRAMECYNVEAQVRRRRQPLQSVLTRR